MTKEKVLVALKELPERFDVEELIERLIFLQQIDEGLAQSDSNQVVSLEEAKVALSKWLK
ncbi:hypothetical protein [Runella sp.]|jgi:hypothetical protein|uniref:hypothetical protein n=1 Tax=Runella sp. TaxID=1960881 RepID=UPI00262ECBDB|nr:hypothetical protein [Runella sp.]